MRSEFRIVVIGQAAFGKSVVEALVEAGEQLVGVFCAPDRSGSAPDPIKSASIEHAIPVFQFKRMRDPEAVAAYRALNPDLCVMAFVTDIVPLEMLTAPTHGAIQYHPSLLPKHRGPSSINWPIIQGETKTGLSIFWPDEGLDTGPILMQKEVSIDPDDTLGTLYFNKLFPLGVEAMVDSVRLVKAGKAPRIEQDHAQMTYESWCKAEQAVVDWSNPVAQVYDLVRGCDPSPGANSSYNGSTVKFFSASKIENATTAPPGEIVALDSSGISIACGGGLLKVNRVQVSGGNKQSAAEWAASAGVTPGARFGI